MDNTQQPNQWDDEELYNSMSDTKPRYTYANGIITDTKSNTEILTALDDRIGEMTVNALNATHAEWESNNG